MLDDPKTEDWLLLVEEQSDKRTAKPEKKTAKAKRYFFICYFPKKWFLI